jgi:hypothetical protein
MSLLPTKAVQQTSQVLTKQISVAFSWGKTRMKVDQQTTERQRTEFLSALPALTIALWKDKRIGYRIISLFIV